MVDKKVVEALELADRRRTDARLARFLEAGADEGLSARQRAVIGGRTFEVALTENAVRVRDQRRAAKGGNEG